jgi:predicted small secreted protein
MKKSIGFAAAMLVCTLTVISAAGCNTFRGAGKDIQTGGQAVENAAVDTQRGMEHPRTHTIAASAESGGMISPSGSTSVVYGSHQTFTVKANRGHHVADVLVDGNSVGAVSRYTFDNVTAHHTISALFAVNAGY